MNRKNALYFHALEGSVKTSDVIAAFDAFTARYALEYAVHKKPCIIILDNASIHTSAAFLAEQDAWAALRRGLALLANLQSRTELDRNTVAFCEISLVAFVELFELRKFEKFSIEPPFKLWQ